MGSMIFACAGSCGATILTAFASSCAENASNDETFARILYAFMLLFWSCLSWVLKNLPSWTSQTTYFDWIPGFADCNQTDTEAHRLCYGAMTVYRFCAALAVFHLMFTLAMLGVSKRQGTRHSLQHSWWSIKIVLLLFLVLTVFFIPNPFFLAFGWVSLIGSGFFILLQLILLVDFAHGWNESWVAKYYETESNLWAFLLVGATGLMYSSSLVLIVLLCVYFLENQEQCWVNVLLISLNIAFIILISAFSTQPKVQERNPRIGLFPASVVSLYSTYLVWSAVTTEPLEWSCSSWPLQGDGSGFSLLFGVALTFLSLIYSALSVSTQLLDQGDYQDPTNKDPSQPLVVDEDTALVQEEEHMEQEMEKADEVGEVIDTLSVTYSYSFFHLTFFLATLYLTMVLTNWEILQRNAAWMYYVDRGVTAFWIKGVSSWLVMILFFWTMIAPILLPHRSFEQ